jgi:medium-chain acyl-[acyl-carrier-protein] hydrolase
LSGEWFTVPRPAPAARLRLVCFPYAGGGASAYWRWAAALPAGIELAAVTLPGREARFDEPPHESLAVLLPELLDALGPYQRPVAFFGHSMGALIAFELCRALARDGLPAPRALVVSGRRAPHLPAPAGSSDDLSDPALCAQLRAYGGTSDEVFAEPALLELVLPTFRADLVLAAGYRYRPAPPLETPIIAYGGVEDAETSAAEIAGWAEHTSAGFDSRFFPGGHSFPFEGDGVVQRLGADLCATAEGRS